jgi:AraC-like DNA-binding protein
MYTVIKYIHEHIDEKLTVSELARRFGYSKWYFCDLFKQFFGTTFVEYIRTYRMQLAMLEIMDGKKCVDVAVKYGYETQSGFNKAFLKEFGCLPREFKHKSEAFHLAYKERKKDMYKLSDRCAILREGAVIKKTLNRKICGQRSVLFSLGIVESFEAGIRGKESVRAAGIANVIKNSVPYIQEGEMIVGYNYADAPFNDTWRPRDNENDRELLLENGFKQEQIDRYFETYQAAKGCIPRSDRPVFDKTEKELDEEWAALGRCITDNHTVLGYEQVLTLGFEGLLSKVERCEASNGSSDLYHAMKTLCRAGLVFGEKYADLAKEMRSDPTLSDARVAELQTIENTCRRVTRKACGELSRGRPEPVFCAYYQHLGGLYKRKLTWKA